MGHFQIGLSHGGGRKANHMKSLAYVPNSQVPTTNGSNFQEIRSIHVTVVEEWWRENIQG